MRAGPEDRGSPGASRASRSAAGGGRDSAPRTSTSPCFAGSSRLLGAPCTRPESTACAPFLALTGHGTPRGRALVMSHRVGLVLSFLVHAGPRRRGTGRRLPGPELRRSRSLAERRETTEQAVVPGRRVGGRPVEPRCRSRDHPSPGPGAPDVERHRRGDRGTSGRAHRLPARRQPAVRRVARVRPGPGRDRASAARAALRARRGERRLDARARLPRGARRLLTEAATIAKDSTGTLWVAWTRGLRVWLAHTTGSELASG